MSDGIDYGNIVVRPMAMIGKLLCVSCEPGTKIFDISTEPETLLGIVMDRHPVINHKAHTVYLSTDDYRAAKAALPAGDTPAVNASIPDRLQ